MMKNHWNIKNKSGLWAASLLLVTGAMMSLSLMVTVDDAHARQGFQMPPANVVVETATKRMMAPALDANGTVISLNNAEISSEVAGPLKAIANVGTMFKAGDVIAEVDARLLSLAVDRAKANVKRLEADMVFKEADVKRYQQLASSDSASKARLEASVAARDMTAQDIIDAKAILSQAEGDLARANIKAPFAGVLVQRMMNVGEYVNRGNAVARLVAHQDLEVVVPAPLELRPFLSEGKSVAVYSESGAKNLAIRTAVPVADQVSRMIEVRLSLADGDWVVGTPVKVKLPKAEAQEMISIHRDAVMIRGSSVFAYVVGPENKAERRDLSVGNAVGDYVSILSGIEEGEKVVVRGAERLQPGRSLAVSEGM